VKVVVTGGTGFLGLALTRRLLARGALTAPSGVEREIERLVLVDVELPGVRPLGLDERVELVAGDVAQPDVLSRLVDRDDVSVFHLASIVSAAAERDFDAALRVNLGGTRNVLEACRARRSAPRVVFASSVAVFGGEAVAEPVTDTTRPTPETTYGTTKALGELLVSDYTRKGFLDGRAARLPTVIIRPGRPNPAASAWASGIFREPLNGETCELPVPLETRIPVAGHRTVVENLIGLHEADGPALGGDRALNFPGLSVTAREMVESLRRVAGPRRLGPIAVRRDAAVEAIVRTWARWMSADRAERLGLVCDEGLDGIVEAYIEDFLDRP
jgi:nucleoside-diphosphate-sugar epimerase